MSLLRALFLYLWQASNRSKALLSTIGGYQILEVCLVQIKMCCKIHSKLKDILGGKNVKYLISFYLDCMLK